MSERRSFIRKVAYLVAVAVLLLPLSWLSMPASGDNAGGKLARLRREQGLAQASLGEIDPASETMKLATLGMRGVAANLLWEKANYYKKTEDWTNFSATLEQITKLQPNFISVWKFQAWNLSYNVSVEFDDYRDRYRWVIRGIDFLKEGVKYNGDDPQLLWDTGWFIGNKLGRADEHKQYRRLFVEDDDFHAGSDRTRQQRDNWLVGREWFQKAEDAVKHKGKRLKGKSPLIFHSDSAMSLINYAEALEEDGTYGERAGYAWESAGKAWYDYGTLRIPSTYGIPIHLNDRERREEEAAQLREQINAIEPGVAKKIEAQRRDALSPEERAAYDLPPAERTREQYDLANQARDKMLVTPKDVADRIAELHPEKAQEAARLGRLTMRADREAQIIGRYRQIVNFEYWRTRCEFEQTADALTARELIYRGDQALARADLLEARKLYDEGMASWRKVLDAYPSIRDEGTTGEDLLEVIKRYRKILNEIDEEFPRDFILRDVIEAHDRDGDFQDIFPPSAAGAAQPAGATPDGATADGTTDDSTTPPAAAPQGTPPAVVGPDAARPAIGAPPEPPAE